jgi:hypothetical protein
MRSRPWLFRGSKVVGPAYVDDGPHCFGLDGEALICTNRMSGFMGPDKLSSLVTTLSNCPPLLRGCLRRENEVAQDDNRVGRSLETKISSWEQRPNFNLVRTLQKVVVCETREATRTMCCQVFPLQGVYQFESL